MIHNLVYSDGGDGCWLIEYDDELYGLPPPDALVVEVFADTMVLHTHD